MNIYDIAKEAGVSPATVSRVINGNKNVRKSTRDKVLKVISGKNYVPNMTARSLSVGESKTIAFLVPDIENSFFAKILHGITDKAADYDYNVFMFGTDENPDREHKVLDSLKAEMIKGIIIIPVYTADDETKLRLDRFEERGIPVVLLDRDIRGANFDGVFSEDGAGAFQAVESLIQEGHRQIGIISGPDTSRPGYERLRGYKNALSAYGIKLQPEYVVNGSFREEESYNAMKTLMTLKNPPTAVFTSNNKATLGCLRYLKENGLRLSRDISLIGFDDIPELAYTDVHLTVVTRPVYEMGYETMELLETRFQGRPCPPEQKIIKRENLVKTWLIKRGSEKYCRANAAEADSKQDFSALVR